MTKFDWEMVASSFTPEQGRALAAERGLDPLTFERLRDRKLIGSVYVEKFKARCIAFPIQDKDGNVYRSHLRGPQRDNDGKWPWAFEPTHDPLDRPITALAIGNPVTANRGFIFESQWDGIALIERLALFEEIDSGEICVVATRGALSTARIKAIPWTSGISLYAFPQNDPAGNRWLTDVLTIAGGLNVVQIPSPHKDLGDWVKDPAFDITKLEWMIDDAPLRQPKSGAKQSQPGQPQKANIRNLKPEQNQVLLPKLGRNERSFADESGRIIGPTNVAFLHQDRVVEILDEQIPQNERDRLDRNNLARGGLKFRSLTGARTKGWIEQFLTTGHMVKALNGDGKPLRDLDGRIVMEFKEKTMSEENGRSLIENPFFQKHLPKIKRILSVPLPILTPQGDIRIPQPGFNPELGIYCASNTPTIQPLDIEQALEILEAAHQGFEFKNAQSRTHAYARFFTPYFRGHIGFLEPVPCWFFTANRPRAGKDYLSGITQIVYEGFPFEDAALSDNADETCKRITAGLLAGRRFFHFANCQGYLHDKYFIQAITDSAWRVRLLGSNNAQSDLLIPNEAEYSMSANTGLTYREDVEPRLRKIELAYYEEDANSRIFPVEDLHGWVTDNRSLLLSIPHTIYQYWVKKGCPEAHPFTSYKRWGKFIGGALKLLGLGDPTLPHDEDPLIASDLRTAALKAVFELCYGSFPDLWKDKRDIYTLVAANPNQDERLEWFGDFSNPNTQKKAALKLCQALASVERRWFSGIRLLIDTSQANVWRRKLKFSKICAG